MQDMPDGHPIGWDLAGTVVSAAVDGSGPPQGARVVGLVQETSWAQLAAVETDWLAELPDGVSFEQASTLPVAGLTALIALEEIGSVIGRRVLVTGASGGVGRLAVQLAAIGGAHVTAVSRNAERARGLQELGASDVIHELSAEGQQFDAILEGVGGASLSAAMQRIAPGGTIASYAASDTSQVQFPGRAFFVGSPGARLYGLYVFSELRRGHTGSLLLRRLADLVAAGRLDCSIDHTGSWREAAAAIEALMARRIAGKAVMLTD